MESKKSICRNLLSIGMVGLTIAAALPTQTAQAQIPITRDSCMSGAGNIGRQMGIRNAARIVNAIWHRLGQTCDQVDRLAQILSETPLARPAMGGVFSACFYLGYTDTLWDQLDQTYTRCGQLCFDAGSEVGRISAEGYCAASMAVGGLDDPGFIEQPPLPFCGENLVFGCKSEYVTHASFEINGCYPFTIGSFENTFDDSVRQDCFVPSDVPIRDGGNGLMRVSSSLDDGSLD